MADNNIGSLVVLKWGRIRGILTERDILIGLAKPGTDMPFASARDMMTESVYTITPGSSLPTANALMLGHKIKKLPVLDGDILVGILTATDIMSRIPSLGAKIYRCLKT